MMDKQRRSQYNYYLPARGVVANTRTGAIVMPGQLAVRSLMESAIDHLTPGQQQDFLEKGILVRPETDELELVLKERRRQKNRFQILTTTDCNAACAYCYQKDLPHIDMNEKTAAQTVEFISQKMEGQSEAALIEWFGGEPLLNTEAIDIICSGLRTEQMPFFSSITTNASAFHSGLLHRIASDWHLSFVQVTLDGVGNRHEMVKGLPEGTFDRILSGLQELMEQGVLVNVRINHTDSAVETELIDFLAQRFDGYYDKLCISIAPLYQARGAARKTAMTKIVELRDFLCDRGLAAASREFRIKPIRNRCPAAEGGCTIAPDGSLYSCVHCMTEQECYGSVWEYKEDHPARKRFLSRDLSDRCRSCLFFPICLGGCRAAELGLAQMDQCQPDSLVFEEILGRVIRYLSS